MKIAGLTDIAAALLAEDLVITISLVRGQFAVSINAPDRPAIWGTVKMHDDLSSAMALAFGQWRALHPEV